MKRNPRETSGKESFESLLNETFGKSCLGDPEKALLKNR